MGNISGELGSTLVHVFQQQQQQPSTQQSPAAAHNQSRPRAAHTRAYTQSASTHANVLCQRPRLLVEEDSKRSKVQFGQDNNAHSTHTHQRLRSRRRWKIMPNPPLPLSIPKNTNKRGLGSCRCNPRSFVYYKQSHGFGYIGSVLSAVTSKCSQLRQNQTVSKSANDMSANTPPRTML